LIKKKNFLWAKLSSSPHSHSRGITITPGIIEVLDVVAEETAKKGERGENSCRKRSRKKLCGA